MSSVFSIRQMYEQKAAEEKARASQTKPAPVKSVVTPKPKVQQQQPAPAPVEAAPKPKAIEKVVAAPIIEKVQQEEPIHNVPTIQIEPPAPSVVAASSTLSKDEQALHVLHETYERVLGRAALPEEIATWSDYCINAFENAEQMSQDLEFRFRCSDEYIQHNFLHILEIPDDDHDAKVQWTSWIKHLLEEEKASDDTVVQRLHEQVAS